MLSGKVELFATLMKKLMDDQQTVNVLGAISLHLADQIRKHTDAAAKHGAAGPSALVSIFNHPAETIDYLRLVLGLTHSGTVRLVDRLVSAGLVVRRKGADSRSLALECTKLGAKRANVILAARHKVIQPLIDVLSEEEKAHLQTILRKFPWEGVTTKVEALRTCRLCNESVCVANAECPVSQARISSTTTPTSRKNTRSRSSRAHLL